MTLAVTTGPSFPRVPDSSSLAASSMRKGGPADTFSSQPGSCLSALLAVWTRKRGWSSAQQGQADLADWLLRVCLPALLCCVCSAAPPPPIGPLDGPHHAAPSHAGHVAPATPILSSRASALPRCLEAQRP